MPLYKAVKLEVKILTEAGMSDEDVIDWTNRALKDHADFAESHVKILESHDNIIANDEEPIA